MTAATVLIPTHSHALTLPHAVAGVLAQTCEDFELFIVGDGASEAVRACAQQLAQTDARIRFFDFPKGPRKGEVHRHAALAEARGRFVAYCGDDDFWLPEHLATLDALLADADFGHTLHIGIDAAGKLFALPADLEQPEFRARMVKEQFNRFDLTFGAHTLAAYRRLPRGWDVTPVDEQWSDLYLWRQFLGQPWCRARSALVPTGICTQTCLRPHLTDQQRADELALWRARSREPDFRETLWRLAATSLAHHAVEEEMLASAGWLSYFLRKVWHRIAAHLPPRLCQYGRVAPPPLIAPDHPRDDTIIRPLARR